MCNYQREKKHLSKKDAVFELVFSVVCLEIIITGEDTGKRKEVCISRERYFLRSPASFLCSLKGLREGVFKGESAGMSVFPE
jgi:hypothetical protein